MFSSIGDHKLNALVIPLVGGVRLVNGGSREVGGCVGVSDGPVVVLRPACKRNVTKSNSVNFKQFKTSQVS